MFLWLRPLRTSISPQTLSSFPLTFFLGMILRATSTVIPLSCWLLLEFLDRERNEEVLVLLFCREKVSGRETGSVGDVEGLAEEPAAPCMATGI